MELPFDKEALKSSLLSSDSTSQMLSLLAALQHSDEDHLDGEEARSACEQLLLNGIRELWDTYIAFRALAWREQPEHEEALEALSSAFSTFAESIEPHPPAVHDWPWPLADIPPNPHNQGAEIDFEHNISGLKICGYTVGVQGMRKPERKRFLEHFFKNALPSAVSQVHGDDYGQPESGTRLKKMANVIAAHARNFAMNDAVVYRQAIQDWREDLQFLKDSYYMPPANRFPWPSTGD
jgi:hypothetical protein